MYGVTPREHEFVLGFVGLNHDCLAGSKLQPPLGLGLEQDICQIHNVLAGQPQL